jgi:hypothetical protein
VDLTSGNNVPTPAADPVPFFDPFGNVDLTYVDQSGNVIVLSPNEPASPAWVHLHASTPWRPYIATNVAALSGVSAATSLPSVQLSGANGTLAYRTSTNAIEVLSLSWQANDPVPIYNQVATTLSASSLGLSTTTPRTTNFASDPVVLPANTPSFATTLSNGNLVVVTAAATSLSDWTVQNLTTTTGAQPVVGTLALGSNFSTLDLAALTKAGNVELFTTPNTTSTSTSSPVWNEENLTSLASGAPPLAGALTVQVTSSQIAVAGQAANWGDLFVLTSPTASTSWSATNVSVTAGSSARTVGNIVAGLQVNGQLTLYAAGVSSPPPQGVGVYAIPSATWSQAISDGWPIISETGGLGTQSAPWVGFTGGASVATSPDFLMGQAIYNAHKRVTWLSFWTVSGPLAGQAQTPSNYYSHGFAAGAWVATQIDTYRSLGVGLKPDWVILDPEGFPDDHSNLDAPAGASNATIARYATYWSSMLSGWQAGIASVDPTLNAGAYASQSEYRNYQLSNVPLPMFIALAFSQGGPVPVPGANGSNVRGFISFGAACSPASTLASEVNTLLNPPWAGQFNTLQFNSGVFCAPPTT